jgi:Phage integrase family
MTTTDLGRFLAAANEGRLLFLVLAHTGVRIGELLGLRWESVNLGDHPHVSISGELKSTSSERIIPISSGLARHLGDWRQESEYPADSDPVFASGTGTPLDYANVRHRYLEPARKAAGMEWVTFHTSATRSGASSTMSAPRPSGKPPTGSGMPTPAFTLREYVHSSDLGDADFLDELIPDGSVAPNVAPNPPEADSSQKKTPDYQGV